MNLNDEYKIFKDYNELCTELKKKITSPIVQIYDYTKGKVFIYFKKIYYKVFLLFYNIKKYGIINGYKFSLLENRINKEINICNNSEYKINL